MILFIVAIMVGSAFLASKPDVVRKDPSLFQFDNYCEYDDAHVRGKTKRYTRCWSVQEQPEKIE